MNVRYIILRPGGNDTGLVIGIEKNFNERKKINDKIMAQYPNVEQVGFVNLDLDNLELMMAGGEFCGNATRSTAWLALKGQPGEVKIKVSGVGEELKAGVKENGDAWAQMPIYGNPNDITFDENGVAIVKMDGIIHLVMDNPFDSIAPERTKKFAYRKLKELGLLKSAPASGVILLANKGGAVKIEPVVWVRDIGTLFYETACGSGTTAVGLVLALQRGGSVNTTIFQPSGMGINVKVDFNGEKFQHATISGPIKQLVSERKLTNEK